VSLVRFVLAHRVERELALSETLKLVVCRRGCQPYSHRVAHQLPCPAQLCSCAASMSQHPAAEIVAIALRKIQKVANNKKYQALLDASQGLLEALPTLLPVPGSTTASSSTAVGDATDAVKGINAAAAAGSVQQHSAEFDGSNVQAAGGDGASAPTLEPQSVEQTLERSLNDLNEGRRDGEATQAEGSVTGQGEEAAGGAPLQPTAAAAPAAAAGAAADGSPKAPATSVVALPDLVPRTATAIEDSAALRIVAVMRLAVETDRPNIIEVALDCLQKLIAFKFLQVWRADRRRGPVLWQSSSCSLHRMFMP
jgi:hypothetical protein